jgi:hypothetical protein
MLTRGDLITQRGESTIEGGFPGHAPLCRPAPSAGRPVGGANRIPVCRVRAASRADRLADSSRPPTRRCRSAGQRPRVTVSGCRQTGGLRAGAPVRGPPRRQRCPRTCCPQTKAGPVPTTGPANRDHENCQWFVMPTMLAIALAHVTREDAGHSRRGPTPPAPPCRATGIVAREPAAQDRLPDPHRMSRQTHKETGMLAIHAVHNAHQNLMAVRALIIVLAVSGVIFWRAAIKIIIAIGIVLVTSGAIAFLQGVLHVIK